MGGYNRDRSGDQGRGGRQFHGAGRSYGKPSFGRRDRDEGRSQMHRTTCDECGDQCEVPFRPSGDKPVFCNDCFGKDSGRPARKDFRDNFREKPERRRDFKEERPAKIENSISKEQFEMLNAKLDRILKLITPVIEVSKEEQAKVQADLEKSAIKKAKKADKSVAVKETDEKPKKSKKAKAE
jgi:CxxC-x17-CxxC domain-containing protein